MNRRQMIAGSISAGLTGRAVPAQTGAGFFVPREDTRHQCTFMQWPVSRRVYRDPVFLRMVQKTIARIANTISDFEPVIMLAAKSDHSAARKSLSQAVTLWDIPTEDLWCRDSGPIFGINGRGGMQISGIQFNGWGRKQIHQRDAQISRRVADRLGIERVATGLNGEAGAVEQDGHGTLIAHESSWINNNRNPGLTRDQIETRLLWAYGANRVIWAAGVRGQDITDYHIDSLVRFTHPGQVLMNLPSDPDMADPFHLAALETYDTLNGAGLMVDVIPEPVKRRVTNPDFVASYANFYICNGAVISAQFGDVETDHIAYKALARHFPGHEVIQLNVDTLGELGGGIHCATQQMPVP